MLKMTMAPLPRWQDIFLALLPKTPDDYELSKLWTRDGETGLWLSRSSWALLLIVNWYKQVNGQKNLTIWIPDFFCNEALTLIRKSGVNLIFYPVNEQMKIDVSKCNELAESNPINIFLLVHYFGEPSPAECVKELCSNQNTWLIEDATHVLKPINGIGEIGDIVLYSPHKLLPIPDGSVMVMRPNGPTGLTRNIHAMNLLPLVLKDIVNSSDNNKKLETIWFFTRVAQKIGIRSRKKNIDFDALSVPLKTSISYSSPKMSKLARRMVFRLFDRMEEVSEKREIHLQSWIDSLSWMQPDVLNTSTSNKITPYLASFNLSKSLSSEKTIVKLQKMGLPITSWPDLPPEVLIEPTNNKVAINLRLKRFYLPVHQSLKTKSIMKYSKKLLTKTIESWHCISLTKDEWNVYWALCSSTNMLQSWEYGEAKNSEGWQVSRFLISDEEDTPIAIAQVLTKTLPFIGGVARVNRGPILINSGSDNDTNKMIFSIRVLIKEARRHRWWLFQVAPELPNTFQAINGMKAMGFKKLNTLAWASGVINLLEEENIILMNLAGKWRNTLRKGQKLGVQVRDDSNNIESIHQLTKNYTELQSNRGFGGISKDLILSMASQSGPSWSFNLFNAFNSDNNNDLGSLVSIEAGDTTIYLIGYSNDQGRKMHANSVLLWHAILHAKNNGGTFFDFGGLNESTPHGIAKFKKGLNAKPYQLIGDWRYFLFL